MNRLDQLRWLIQVFLLTYPIENLVMDLSQIELPQLTTQDTLAIALICQSVALCFWIVRGFMRMLRLAHLRNEILEVIGEDKASAAMSDRTLTYQLRKAFASLQDQNTALTGLLDQANANAASAREQPVEKAAVEINELQEKLARSQQTVRDHENKISELSKTAERLAKEKEVSHFAVTREIIGDLATACGLSIGGDHTTREVVRAYLVETIRNAVRERQRLSGEMDAVKAAIGNYTHKKEVKDLVLKYGESQYRRGFNATQEEVKKAAELDKVAAELADHIEGLEQFKHLEDRPIPEQLAAIFAELKKPAEPATQDPRTWRIEWAVATDSAARAAQQELAEALTMALLEFVPQVDSKVSSLSIVTQLRDMLRTAHSRIHTLEEKLEHETKWQKTYLENCQTLERQLAYVRRELQSCLLEDEHVDNTWNTNKLLTEVCTQLRAARRQVKELEKRLDESAHKVATTTAAGQQALNDFNRLT